MGAPHLAASSQGRGGADARGVFRFEFIGEFLTVTEPAVAAIAAGDVTPEEGLAQLQEDLTAVVEDAGYPVG